MSASPDLARASAPPSVSIIICSRDNAESLRRTLRSIEQVTPLPGSSIEILVVDNGSLGETRAVVESIRPANMQLRYISEPAPGQCHARNAGLRNATGDIIFFTDDDVLVPTNWVVGMCEPITGSAGADAVAGGVIFPDRLAVRLATPPFNAHRSWYAATEDIDPRLPHRMVGANMAFHRRVLAKVPGFDTELGPGALGFADETLFSAQLIQAGFKLVSAFDIAVEHDFSTARLTKTSLIDTARKMGRSEAFIYRHWSHRTSHLAILRLAWAHARRSYYALRDGAESPEIFERRLSAEIESSFCREYLKQRLRPPKYTRRGLSAEGGVS